MQLPGRFQGLILYITDMKKAIITLLTGIVFIACKKDHREPVCDCITPYQVSYLKAKLAQTSDISCYLPVLDFSEDSLRIRSLTRLNNLVFTVKYLPAGLIIQGQKIYAAVTDLPAGEVSPCNTLGIPYPQLKVVDAKPRD